MWLDLVVPSEVGFGAMKLELVLCVVGVGAVKLELLPGVAGVGARVSAFGAVRWFLVQGSGDDVLSWRAESLWASPSEVTPIDSM